MGEQRLSSLLLDTHILIWWLSAPSLLAKEHSRQIKAAEARDEPVSISAITLWEIAKLSARKRVQFGSPPDEWLKGLEHHPLIHVVPLTADIVLESVSLGDDFHRDPADQIIVATARCLNLKLLTQDERIRAWGKVRLV